MWSLATDCRRMLGQSYPVAVRQLSSPYLVPLGGSVCPPRATDRGHAMSSVLLSLQYSWNMHRATPPTDKFKQAVHEARNEANLGTFLDLVYKVTLLTVLIVPKLNTLKFSIMSLRR